jgi:hypothetical protein
MPSEPSQSFETTCVAGPHVSASKLTLGRFLTDEWLPAIRANVRPTPWDHYWRNVDAHVGPALGSVQL